MKKLFLIILSIMLSKTYLLFSQQISIPFMAKLKYTNCINATINDSVVFTLTPEQVFLYNNESHMAYLSNGQFGYIPPDKVKKIQEQYFKFQYVLKDFNLSDDNEMVAISKKNGISIKKILNEVISKKSEQSMIDLFNLNNIMDGAAAENFSELFWKVINYWTDNDLFIFLNKQNNEFKNKFCKFIILPNITWPIVDYEQYYRLYYPKTWKIIKDNIPVNNLPPR